MNIHELTFTATTLQEFTEYLQSKHLKLAYVENNFARSLGEAEVKQLCAEFTASQAIKVIYPEKKEHNHGNH